MKMPLIEIFDVNREKQMTILPYALGIGLIRHYHLHVPLFIHLIIGPSVIDRLLALDTLFLNATCLVVVLGIYWVSNNMFEGALLVAMLGFVSTAAWHAILPLGHVTD